MGDLIVARVFKDEKTGEPNPHAQTAMMAHAMVDPEYANSPKTLARLKEVNDIRLFFGLASMTPEARTAFRSRQ